MMTTNVTFMRVTAKVTFFGGRFQLLLLLLEYLNIRYHKIHQHLRKSEKQLFNTLSCVGFMTVPKETPFQEGTDPFLRAPWTSWGRNQILRVNYFIRRPRKV